MVERMESQPLSSKSGDDHDRLSPVANFHRLSKVITAGVVVLVLQAVAHRAAKAKMKSKRDIELEILNFEF
jgi:hypothetical protein